MGNSAQTLSRWVGKGVSRVALSLALLATTATCSSAYRGKEPPQPRSERVAGSDTCLDISYCAPFRPFFRVGTDAQVGQVFWLLSTQGHACVVTSADFVLAVPGEQWSCAGGWRFRRG